MNPHRSQQQILSVLQRVGPKDLRIPDTVRLSIPFKEHLRTYLAELTDFAETCRGSVIPSLPYSYFKLFHETGNRSMYETSDRGFFRRRKRLVAFGILAWLYEREEDIRELEDIIWAICDEYTWSLPAHIPAEAFTSQLESQAYTVDLFAAETADALAEIVLLLGEKLSPLVRKRIANALEERIFRRVAKADHAWMGYTFNWSAVCAGAVGMAAICTITDEAYLSHILSRLLPAFDAYLSGFPEDGACLEGLSYWQFGFRFFVSFADMLLRRTAGEMDLFDHPKVPKIAAFQQKCFFPGGRTLSFSDGNSRAAYRPWLTDYLSRKYADVTVPPGVSRHPSYTHSDSTSWNDALRLLIWTEEPDQTAAAFAPCYLLPQAQWFIGHSPMGAGIAAKAGYNEEPHNHNDVGSFQYFLNGEEMLCDLGAGQYTRQYFHGNRYDFLACGSQGHNVPMIDGCTQRFGKEACASEVILNENGITMEMVAAYGLEALQSLTRSICFDTRSGCILLTDTFALVGTHEICERFITYGEVVPGKEHVLILLNGQHLRIDFDSEQWLPSVSPLSFVASGGIERNLFALDFKTMATDNSTFLLRVTPV